MKNLSSQISKVLDIIIKNADEVMKQEKQAREAAKNMEEASFKAQIARRNMISVIFLNFYPNILKKNMQFHFSCLINILNK